MLALLYLFDLPEISLGGFAVMGAIIAYMTARILNNTLPASCDLCGAQSTMTVEYGAGFSGARLILNCRQCGRVINGAPGSMRPEKEKP